MFKRILVPLDGSAFAERAIPHAEQFAKIFGANLVLLRVLDVSSFQDSPIAIDPLKWQIRKTDAEIYLKQLSERIEARLSTPPFSSDNENEPNQQRVDYALREGRVAENIVNYAHEEHIDLVVIGTHGMGGLSRWNISSVTHKVLSLIYLPVLVIRAYGEQEAQPYGHHYHRILIPVDSSRRAECVLSTGIAIREGQSAMYTDQDLKNTFIEDQAGSASTELVLMSVIKPPEIPFSEPYPDDIKQLREEFLKISRISGKNYLENMKKYFADNCETFLIEDESIPAAIHNITESEKIDLVLMSAHGYGGQFNYPYGSIVRNTIEHGSVPILVIQDIPLSQVKPTPAETAFKRFGGR